MFRACVTLLGLFWVTTTHVEELPAEEAAPVPAEQAGAAAAEPEWRPLVETVDAALQRALERAVGAKSEWRRLVQREKLAVGLVDLSTPVPRFARVNGDHMMYAASLPKIAVLLAAYVSFDDGSLIENEELHRDLKDMIQVSDNGAATRMIDAVGMPKIEQVMRDPRFGFYSEENGGGLWVGKRYAASGLRRGDPLFDISHGATDTQVCRFYYLLASGRLIDAQRSAEMLEDLADPGLHHKFVASLDERAPGARLFRKSGTWKTWHSDSVLVQGPDWRKYILVALVESANGETILRDLVPAVEAILEPRPPR
jgi:beta-lactamase class A